MNCGKMRRKNSVLNNDYTNDSKTQPIVVNITNIISGIVKNRVRDELSSTITR